MEGCDGCLSTVCGDGEGCDSGECSDECVRLTEFGLTRMVSAVRAAVLLRTCRHSSDLPTALSVTLTAAHITLVVTLTLNVALTTC